MNTREAINAVFHYSIKYGRDKLTAILIDNPLTDINVDECYYLCLAAKSGNMKNFNLLIDRGLNPRARNDEPLSNAIKNNQEDVVEKLLEFYTV